MGPRRMRKQGSDDEEEERDAFESPVQSDLSDEEVDAQEEADPPEAPPPTTPKAAAPAPQEAQEAPPEEAPAAAAAQSAAEAAGPRPPMPQGAPPSRPPVRPKIIEEDEVEVEITGHLESSDDEEVAGAEPAVREEEAEEVQSAKKDLPEEIPLEVIVPRATQYFLHDDRYEEPKAGENGHADDRDVNDASGRKGRGRQRVFSSDDDGPWKHDKYYEMVEEDRRRGGPPRGKGSRRIPPPGGDSWRPNGWEAWEDWAGWEQDGRWDNSWSKSAKGGKGGAWRQGEWVPGTWQPKGW